MSHAILPIARRPFGQTMRKDRWWIQPLVVFVVLSSFLVYATWAAFQNAHYTFGLYLSPFYSPDPAASGQGGAVPSPQRPLGGREHLSRRRGGGPRQSDRLRHAAARAHRPVRDRRRRRCGSLARDSRPDIPPLPAGLLGRRDRGAPGHGPSPGRHPREGAHRLCPSPGRDGTLRGGPATQRSRHQRGRSPLEYLCPDPGAGSLTPPPAGGAARTDPRRVAGRGIGYIGTPPRRRPLINSGSTTGRHLGEACPRKSGEPGSMIGQAPNNGVPRTQG